MKYGPDKTKEICAHIAGGLSRNDAIILSDITVETFYQWMKKPEFSEAIRKAEVQFKGYHLNNIAEHAKKTWQASAWILERKFFNEFGLQKKEEAPNVDDMKRLAQQTIEFMKQLNANGLPTTPALS